jgi:hypothetical protein
MAKATISFEDTGSKTLSIITEIAGIEKVGDAVSPAMAMALATRAMFESGMLAEAAGIALAAIAKGEVPSECILDHFTKKKKVPRDDR